MKVKRNSGFFRQLEVMEMMLFLAQNPQEENEIIKMCKKHGVDQESYREKLRNQISKKEWK